MTLVKLLPGVPVDLYAAATVAVGRELLVESLSEDPIRLFTTTAAPSPADGYGLRAVNVQSYDESNRKLGTQWGASRRLLNAALNQKFYSILKARTLPIDLKSRVFSYNGAGLIARFYTGFAPQVLPAAEPVFCARPARPAFRDFDLYALAAAPTSLGARWAADLFLEGAAQVQGKGAINAVAGQGWVIDPNTEVLLEIESLDAGQNIGVTLALYNGLLDLPLP